MLIAAVIFNLDIQFKNIYLREELCSVGGRGTHFKDLFSFVEE